MAEKAPTNHIHSSRISKVDKEILKILLEPDTRVSSHTLSEKLQVPLTTVQRRRNHLEHKYLDISYSLKLRSLGYRRIDFFLYTAGGNTSEIGRELLKRKEVVSVGRSVGEHTIDLRAEAIIKDSGQLLDLLEAMKGMPNVRDVIWSEIVDVIGKKQSIPSEVIDAL
jgi:DNA-binding Lrp family transcriptional regulator